MYEAGDSAGATGGPQFGPDGQRSMSAHTVESLVTRGRLARHRSTAARVCGNVQPCIESPIALGSVCVVVTELTTRINRGDSRE